jgi:hypothetical protein
MSEHEAIERETVRLLVEALKREHRHSSYGMAPERHPDCPVCQLIKRFDK